MTEALSWDEIGEDDLEDMEPDAPRSVLSTPSFEAPTRPSLEALTRDQQRLIRSWIGGFEDREDLLMWSHEAMVVTLGQLPPEWHRSRLMSLAELTTVIVDDGERRRWMDEDDLLSRDRAREWRLAVASSDLLPACQRAIRKIRWSAVEYTHDHDDDDPAYVNVGDQSEPAMRPALGEARTRQRWVLEEGVRGFDALEDIVETWIPTADHASFGELDEDLASSFWSSASLRSMFIERDDRAAQFFRESFLALEFLPAFNVAVEQLADRAGEAVAGGETTDHSPADYPSR